MSFLAILGPLFRELICSFDAKSFNNANSHNHSKSHNHRNSHIYPNSHAFFALAKMCVICVGTVIFFRKNDYCANFWEKFGVKPLYRILSNRWSLWFSHDILFYDKRLDSLLSDIQVAHVLIGQRSSSRAPSSECSLVPSPTQCWN